MTDQEKADREAFYEVDRMCRESLYPEAFEKWDQVRNELIRVRSALKNVEPLK